MVITLIVVAGTQDNVITEMDATRSGTCIRDTIRVMMQKEKMLYMIRKEFVIGVEEKRTLVYTCSMSKHLINLYQASKKRKRKIKTNFLLI